MALPTNVDTGRVEGRFIVGVVDGPDGDLDPDGIPAQGTVTFTASVPYLPNPFAAPSPVTILKAPIIGVLDAEGYLCTPDPADPSKPGYRGLRLIATDDPDLSVTGWTWTVTYNFQRVSGTALSIASHSMALPSGSTVDLTTVVKVPSSNGIGIEQAEALAAQAAQAAAEAASQVDTAAQAAVQAQAAADAAADSASQATQATDTAVAGLLESGEQTAPILAAKVDRGALYVEAADYGAVGDGVTDDTAALQAWLDAPGPVRRLHDGIYRITGTLTSTEPGRRIICDGATILAGDGAASPMLTVTGAGSDIRADLDGGEVTNRGLDVTAPGVRITDGTYQRFGSDTSFATAIRVETLGGVTIRGNRITTITSTGDSTIGNTNGAARAITLTGGGGDATDPSYITDNIIDGVRGEEGDAIHLAFGADPSTQGKVWVRDNIISNVSRRAIKIQASDVDVRGNTYRHTDPAPANASALIDVQYSDDVTVEDNDLDATYFMGIQVTGRTTDLCERIRVNRNRITGSATGTGIPITYTRDLTVVGNQVKDGLAGITIGASHRVTVSENTMTGGGAAGSFAISVSASCTEVTARGNTGYDGPRAAVVSNASPGALVEGTRALFSTSGNAIRSAASASKSTYRGSSSTVASAVAFGTFTDQTVAGTVNTNPSGSAGVGADAFWATADPSTSLPNRVSARGDIAWNSSAAAGGVLGWICVTAGTPGAWKALGTIAA